MAIKFTWHIILLGFCIFLLMPTSAPALVINEIHFNPSLVGDDDGEFLELYNEEADIVDLMGYTMGGISVDLQGIKVEAGGFVVLASEPVDDGDTDSDSFDTIYGNGDSLLTEFHFPVIDFIGSLANTGEVLILYGPGGGVVDLYDYTPFVRSNADGGRFSVERIDPMLPSGDANFRVSETSGGTPGMWNSAVGTISSGDVTPVPEPSTWILLATGLLFFCPIVTKKQKL